MGDVYVIAAGMTKFDKWPEKPVKQLSVDALEALFKDSPVPKERIEAAWFGNAGWGMAEFQHCIRGQVALMPFGIQGIPIMNVENACAGGSNAFHGAWMGIKAGLYDVTLALGVEKLFDPNDKKRTMEGFMSGTDVEVTRKIIESMKAEARRKREQLIAEGKLKPGEKEKERSAFMDIYAMGARMHMGRFGTTQRQLAAIAAKNHNNGALNPFAQYQFPMTVDEVMNDTLVAFPLTRAMCAPIGDGAAAAILCSDKFLKTIDSSRAVKVRASVIQSGMKHGPDEPGIGERCGKRAYEMAGLGPNDIQVAELHDATAFGEMLLSEELGFCAKGQGGRLAESGATQIGGKLAINTSGGLECRGHPIGATGLAQICEIVSQLRGEAGKRQVKGARIGLTENGGGFMGVEEAAMAIHIFEK